MFITQVVGGGEPYKIVIYGRSFNDIIWESSSPDPMIAVQETVDACDKLIQKLLKEKETLQDYLAQPQKFTDLFKDGP